MSAVLGDVAVPSPRTSPRGKGFLSRGLRYYELWLRAHLVPYVFLAPALVIYGVFLVVPIATSLWYSLTAKSAKGHTVFVGLQNYTSLFSTPGTLTALRNTVIWVVVMVLVPTGIGLFLANMLRGAGRWKIVTQTMFYLPTVIPMVGVALIWQWMYNPQFGFINSFLTEIGLSSLALDWLGSPTTALPALLIAGIWVSIGLPMVLYLAGLQSISPELYEASRVDGAGRWAQFRYVTMPGLRQMNIIILALQVIGALQVFAIVLALTGGGPGYSTQVLGTWMYYNIFNYGRPGYGSAVGWVLTVMGLAVAVPYVLWMVRGEEP